MKGGGILQEFWSWRLILTLTLHPDPFLNRGVPEG